MTVTQAEVFCSVFWTLTSSRQLWFKKEFCKSQQRSRIDWKSSPLLFWDKLSGVRKCCLFESENQKVSQRTTYSRKNETTAFLIHKNYMQFFQSRTRAEAHCQCLSGGFIPENTWMILLSWNIPINNFSQLELSHPFSRLQFLYSFKIENQLLVWDFSTLIKFFPEPRQKFF